MLDLVSVVVPVFMVESYLDCCIQSIVNQTYRNLEIILIDDGSQDCCPQICDKWAELDPRIIVIHKRNEGVSKARNVGIEKAGGKYIVFVDGDDFLEPLYIEYLYRALCDTGADVSECRYTRCPVFLKNTSDMKRPVLQTAEEALQIWCHPNPEEFNLVVWNKMYHNRLVKEVCFAEGYKGGEDVLFTCYIFGKSRKIAHIDNELYHWRDTPNSLSKKFPDNTMDSMELSFPALDYLNQNYPSIATEFKIHMCHLINVFLYCLQYETISGSKYNASDKMLSFRRRIHFTVKEWLQRDLKDKIIIICSNAFLVRYYIKIWHLLYLIRISKAKREQQEK